MIDRLGSILFVTAIAFLVFVGGAMAVLGETFPRRYLRDAYLVGEALIGQRRETGTTAYPISRRMIVSLR